MKFALLKLRAPALLLMFLLVIFSAIFFSSRVEAATTGRYPRGINTDSIFYDANATYNADADSPNGYLVVAQAGGNSSLQAGKTTVEAYFDTVGAKTIVIEQARQCGTPDWQDVGHADGSYTTAFRAYKSNSTTSFYAQGNGGSCTNPDMTINFTVDSTFADNSLGADRTYYKVIIVAQEAVTYGMVNGFKVYASTGTGNVFVVLPESNNSPGTENDYFAVQRRPGAGSGNRDFSLFFAPSCDVKNVQQDVKIIWYDDDWGTTIENDPNFGLQLSRRAKGSSDPWVGVSSLSGSTSMSNANSPVPPSSSSNDGVSLGPATTKTIPSTSGSYTLDYWHRLITKDNGSKDTGSATFDMYPDFEYRLMFTQVSGENGIRFRLPAGTINKYIKCQDPAPINPTGSMSGYNCTAVPPTIGYTLNSPLNKGYITATPSSGGTTLQKNITNTSAGTLKLTDWSPALSPSVSYVYKLYGYASDNTVKSPSGVANSPISTLTASQDISCPPPNVTYPITSSYYPSFQTFNADTVVGGGFGSSCAPKDSGIFAYMKSSSTIDGSGSQLGSFASGDIKGFRSAISNSAYKTLGRGLTFGGSSSGFSGLSPSIGGNYASVSCMKDYFTDTQYSDSTKLVSPATNFGDSTHNNKQVTYTGNPTISGLANYNNKTTYYVDGNVYIAGNITYTNPPAGWANASAIPNFTLVVKGNIYIDNSVTQLDGVYIAQPDGNSGGTIYTCASSIGPYEDVNAIEGSCVGTNYGQTTTSTSTLTFNGVVIANKLVLARVLGDVLSTSPATNTPAEIFNYSPEVILSPPLFRTANGADAGNDDIGILPPIL